MATPYFSGLPLGSGSSVKCPYVHGSFLNLINPHLPIPTFTKCTLHSFLPIDLPGALLLLNASGVILNDLTLEMASLLPGDNAYMQGINLEPFTVLKAFKTYGFCPMTKYTGNQFAHLTHLTLGSVPVVGGLLEVDTFFSILSFCSNLEYLDIQRYSQLMRYTNEPIEPIYLPELKTLLIQDTSEWIRSFLDLTLAPSLTSLDLCLIFNGVPQTGADMLTSWVPTIHGHRVGELMHDVRMVTVNVAQGEHDLTEIKGLPARNKAPSVVLKVLGTDGAASKALHQVWRPRAVREIFRYLHRVFRGAEDIYVAGDFGNVQMDDWRGFLAAYPELTGLHIYDRGQRDADDLFGVLASANEGTGDIYCPALENLVVEGARYSVKTLNELGSALNGRAEASIASVKVVLVDIREEYRQEDLDYAELRDTVCPGVGTFSISVHRWDGMKLFSLDT